MSSGKKHSLLDDALLSTEEAAEFLNRSVRTLADWRYRGKGPRFVKLGKRVAYRPEDLRRYVEENAHESTTEADHGAAE